MQQNLETSTNCTRILQQLQTVCKRINLVAVLNEGGKNLLQRAVIDNKTELVKRLIELAKLSNHQSVDEVICHLDPDERSSLHYALLNGNIYILLTLLFSLSVKWIPTGKRLVSPATMPSLNTYDVVESSLSQFQHLVTVCKDIHLVKVIDQYGCNALQKAVIDDKVGLVYQILELVQLSGQRIDEVIHHADHDGLNAVHYAVLNNHTGIVDVLLSSIPDEENKAVVVAYKDSRDNNLFHLAADLRGCSGPLMKMLVSHMDDSCVEYLMTETNIDGETPCQIRSASLIHSYISLLARPIIFQSTEKTLLASFTTYAVKTNNNELVEEICCWFPRVIEHWLLYNQHKVAFSSTQIRILSSVSKTFIIPTLQTKATRHALVCYSIHQRIGALEEAVELCSALKTKGFRVEKHEWTSFASMRSWVVDRTDEIRDSCSVLALCLMSHGFGGNLMGAEETYGEISNVIDETRKAIPEEIPMMAIIQACQKVGLNQATVSSARGADSLAAGCSSCIDIDIWVEIEDSEPAPKNDMNHVILRAKNCVMLMATVYDGKAYRGHFTSAISTEIRQATASTSVYDMFTNASDKMSHNRDHFLSLQTPEVRSTLRRHLFL